MDKIFPVLDVIHSANGSSILHLIQDLSRKRVLLSNPDQDFIVMSDLRKTELDDINFSPMTYGEFYWHDKTCWGKWSEETTQDLLKFHKVDVWWIEILGEKPKILCNPV